MTREEIKDKLKDIITFAMPDKKEAIEQATEYSNLITDIGLNSVGLLYVVIAVEEFFDISFDGVAFNDFASVKDVVDYIEKQGV